MPIWLGILIAVAAYFGGVFTAYIVFGSYGGGQSSGQSRLDFVVLLGLGVIVLAFVAWELGGLTAGLPIHTISYYAQRNQPLAVGIGIAFPVAGIAGLAWWIRHMRTRIPK